MQRLGVFSTSERKSYFDQLLAGHFIDWRDAQFVPLDVALSTWAATGMNAIIIDDVSCPDKYEEEEIILRWLKGAGGAKSRVIFVASPEREINDVFFYQLVSSVDVKDIVAQQLGQDISVFLPYRIINPTTLHEVSFWKTDDKTKLVRTSEKKGLAKFFAQRKDEKERERIAKQLQEASAQDTAVQSSVDSLAAADEQEQVLEEAVIESVETISRVCPNCGSTLSSEHVFCSTCGMNVSDPQPLSEVEIDEPQEPEKLEIQEQPVEHQKQPGPLQSNTPFDASQDEVAEVSQEDINEVDIPTPQGEQDLQDNLDQPEETIAPSVPEDADTEAEPGQTSQPEMQQPIQEQNVIVPPQGKDVPMANTPFVAPSQTETSPDNPPSGLADIAPSDHAAFSPFLEGLNLEQTVELPKQDNTKLKAPRAKQILAVASSRHGVGCTHLCFALAFELAAKNVKVSVAISDDGVFKATKQQLAPDEESQTHFRFKNVDFYEYYAQLEHSDKYDVVVVDCGLIDYPDVDVNSPALVFERATTKVVVVSGAPWDIYSSAELISKLGKPTVAQTHWLTFSAPESISELFAEYIAAIIKVSKPPHVSYVPFRPLLFVGDKSCYNLYKHILDPVVAHSGVVEAYEVAKLKEQQES